MYLNKSLLCFVLAGILVGCGGGGSSTPTSVSSAASVVPSSSSSLASSSSVKSSSSNMSSSSSSAASGLAFCASLTADADGDGVGLENNQTCQMRTGFDITREMGIGWNLGNTMDAFGSETNWGNPKTTKMNIDTVKTAGFNTLRLPVTWDGRFSGTGHIIDTTWIDRVEEIANYALDNNMYVIINIHHNSGWEAPTLANETNAKDHVVKLWAQIAERFKKYDHRVIFETMNEPRAAVNGVDDWWGKQEYFDVVNRLNIAALDAIRATGGNNEKRLVMIPGYVAGANEHQINAIVLPKDKMLAVSTHAYFPFDFALDQKGTDKFTNMKDIDDTFARLNNKFILNGVPVVMGEWASTNKNNLTDRVKHAEYYVKAATKYGIPTVWWDNGNYNYSATSSDIMGLLNRNTNTWVYPEILEALMRGTQ